MKKVQTLPNHTDALSLANSFSMFFKAKIDKIRENFNPVTPDTIEVCDVECLERLSCVSMDDVSKVILGTKNKHCDLDPIPTSILKSAIDIVLPSITKLINKSIETSTFPSQWKMATVTPLIKKQSLELENMKNYRPVSNLQYLSKVTEKIVLKQVEDHFGLTFTPSAHTECLQSPS